MPANIEEIGLGEDYIVEDIKGFDQILAVTQRKAVEINGFLLVLSLANPKKILITKGDKTYEYIEKSHQYIKNRADYERRMMEAFKDFIATASIGAKGYDHFKAEFGGDYKTEAERNTAFRYYSKAYEWLKQADPEGYADLIK